jgi:hypothetical protein
MKEKFFGAVSMAVAGALLRPSSGCRHLLPAKRGEGDGRTRSDILLTRESLIVNREMYDD